MARASIEIRDIVLRSSVRLNENDELGRSEADARVEARDFELSRIARPNQSSEPTRPAVRFLTFERLAKVTSCSGLVAHL